MGFYRRIEDYFQRPPGNTIDFSEAEKALRLKQMQEDIGPFVYDEDGFTYRPEGRTETIKWAEISRIEAFKLGRPEFDVICLRLYWERGEFSISEDEPGWYQFVSRLKAALPLEQDWEERVIESADDGKGTPLWPISRLRR